jgi:hypothetical protein
MQTIIPETVPPHDNKPSEVPQVQGVDNIGDVKSDNLPPASGIKGVGENHDNEHQTDTLIHQKHNYLSGIVEGSNADDSLDNDINSYNSEEQEDMSECVKNDERERIHYVTKHGRSLKMRKYLFENYDFLQEDAGVDSNSDKVKSLLTKCSLKQGLRFFPEETKKATIAELTQLHGLNVFEPVYQSSMTRKEVLCTLNTLTFIKRKQYGQVRARTCADGRPQRSLFQKWEFFSDC